MYIDIFIWLNWNLQQTILFVNLVINKVTMNVQETVNFSSCRTIWGRYKTHFQLILDKRLIQDLDLLRFIKKNLYAFKSMVKVVKKFNTLSQRKSLSRWNRSSVIENWWQGTSCYLPNGSLNVLAFLDFLPSTPFQYLSYSKWGLKSSFLL